MGTKNADIESAASYRFEDLNVANIRIKSIPAK